MQFLLICGGHSVSGQIEHRTWSMRVRCLTRLAVPEPRAGKFRARGDVSKFPNLVMCTGHVGRFSTSAFRPSRWTRTSCVLYCVLSYQRRCDVMLSNDACDVDFPIPRLACRKHTTPMCGTDAARCAGSPTPKPIHACRQGICFSAL